MEALSWQTQARCHDAADAFFDPEREKEAKALCACCPVRAPCLRYALDTRQEHGVWGGMSAPERTAAAWAAPGDVQLETITYTTRARSTGATCSAGRTSTGWGVACMTHGTWGVAQTRTAAERAVSRPEEWCPACAPIATGENPRIRSSRKG